mmetsp:Transcript_32684/g.52609  ORF Transcript_32684/g.52609 Transcript_32684/m.52609 type:complete len:106 (-) Transcript_32684:50-367(-)
MGAFTIGTQLLGCTIFQETQGDICECVPKKEAKKRRLGDLKTFLEKHQGEDSNLSAKSVIKGKMSTRKYAVVVNELIEKFYPDTIEIRDPRRGWIDPNAGNRDEL